VISENGKQTVFVLLFTITKCDVVRYVDQKFATSPVVGPTIDSNCVDNKDC